VGVAVAALAEVAQVAVLVAAVAVDLEVLAVARGRRDGGAVMQLAGDRVVRRDQQAVADVGAGL
jgi:hypothetical protein